MDKNGNTSEVKIIEPGGIDDSSYEWEPNDTQDVLFLMWAEDEQHAVKIANERRTMLIASGEWTTDAKEWQRRQNGE